MLLTYTGRSPVNIFYLFFFFILVQILGTVVLLFTFGFFDKNPLFIFFKNLFLKILSALGVMKELITDDLIRKEFLINGIAFSVGGIIAIVLKVFFSDIVFGWSSSIEISAIDIKKMISFISFPWSFFWESAVPSLELIEESHYFRVNSKFFLEEIRDLQQIKKLGQWWEFFVACIFFYGILPRLCFYLFEILRPSKVKSIKKKLFQKDPEKVLDLFTFEKDETLFLHSVVNLMLENDVEFEKDFDLKLKKEKWLEKFKEDLKNNHDFSPYTFEQVSKTLRTSIPLNNVQCLIMFCELLTFESYVDIGDKSVKFNENKGLDFLSKLVSLNGSHGSTLKKYSERLKMNIKENTPKGMLQSWLGVALLGGAAAALTGGVGLAAVKIFGLVSVAARTAGFLKIGGGLLNALGFEEEKNMIVMGAGNILGGIRESFDEIVYEKYLKTESIVLRDLGKLETYIDFKFFDQELFEKIAPSLKEHLLTLKKDLSKLDITHSDHLSKYLNKLLNYL